MHVCLCQYFYSPRNHAIVPRYMVSRMGLVEITILMRCFVVVAVVVIIVGADKDHASLYTYQRPDSLGRSILDQARSHFASKPCILFEENCFIFFFFVLPVP